MSVTIRKSKATSPCGATSVRKTSNQFRKSANLRAKLKAKLEGSLQAKLKAMPKAKPKRKAEKKTKGKAERKAKKDSQKQSHKKGQASTGHRTPGTVQRALGTRRAPSNATRKTESTPKRKAKS